MAVWRDVKPKDRQGPHRTRTAPASAASSALSTLDSAAEVLAWQNTVGNRATSALLAGSGPSVSAPARAPSTTATGKRKRADEADPAEQQRRRSSRLTTDADLDHPLLTFTSTYGGPQTQILDEAQEIMFNQEATLHRPNEAPEPVARYYEFRQQVKDGYWTQSTSLRKRLGTNFVQDGPYKPQYDSEVIRNLPGFITFVDAPGWSDDRDIPSGEWMNWYKVFFRWKVKRKETGKEWTSIEVGHSFEAPYNDGNDVAVTASAAGNQNWVVNLT